MRLSRFVERCLFDERYGFYTTQPVFGARGDFVTACDVSQLYGEAVGVFVAAYAAQINVPFVIAEFGPGRGTLACDVVRTIARFPNIRPLFRAYRLIERSAAMKALQITALSQQLPLNTFSHVDNDATHDEDVMQIVLASEFFDALPCDAFKFYRESDGSCVFDELLVTRNPLFGGGFLAAADPFALCTRQTAESHRKATAFVSKHFAFADVPSSLIGASGTLELSTAAVAYASSICKRLRKNAHSIALIIDYGIEGPVVHNSLRGIKKHAFCSPFRDCGVVDISFDVNFGLLQRFVTHEMARLHPAASCSLSACTSLLTQAQFLRALGIEQRALRLSVKQPEVWRDVHRLVNDAQMGVVYKALCIRNPQNNVPIYPHFL